MLSPAFLSQLRRLLPPHSVLHEREDLLPFESDGLSAYRNTPDVVALPENEAQVAAILQLCHSRQGGRGGARRRHRAFAAGALPVDGAVLLVLAKLNQIKPDRPAGAHRHRAARRAQSGHFRSGRGAWPLLRARPVVADRLFDRRQRGGKLRRRALPEIRPHRAQHPQAARLDHRRRAAGNRQRLARQRRLRPAGVDDRLGRHAGGDHRSHGQAAAAPAARAGGAGGVRRRGESRRGGRQHHRRRRHPGRAGNDGQASPSRPPRPSSTPAIRSIARRCCCAKSTASTRKCRTTSSPCARCCTRPARPKSAPPRTRPSA